jgi:uncharacterized protein with GYD domain
LRNIKKISKEHKGDLLAIVKYGAHYKPNLEKLGIKTIEVLNYFGHYDFS